MKINTGSKNFRIILFSVIGLAVLAAVILILTLTSPDSGETGMEEETTTTTIDPALMLQPEDKGDIESIYIENGNGSFTVRPVTNGDGDKIWIVEGMEDLDEGLWVQSSLENISKTLT